MRRIEWRKLGPTKDFVYGLISNLLLLGITLLIGSYWIPNKLTNLDRSISSHQNLIDNRNQFIKEFVELGQKRIYLAERFAKNVKNKESKQTIEKSWADYMDVVIEWNGRSLLNPLFIKYYFDSDLQKEYFDILLNKNLALHDNLLALRHDESVDVELSLEGAKHELFIYSEKLISY